MKKCKWKVEVTILGDNTDTWATSCDNMFEFFNDGPKENGFKYCPYCGGEIEVNDD